ncbi:MAG: sodium:proton antiporter [Armatimonadetes bacterium]|nr:MAG: sodium:proton antiporter [Armatimonadota bacterium]
MGAAILVGVILAYALFSKFLAKTPITGPIIFVLFGVLAGPEALDFITIDLTSDVIQVILEATLVIILFTDAAVIDVAAARRQLTIPSRLLTIGMIGTIAAGIALAAAMFGELGFWGAAVVAVTLTPTDAALGQAVVTNDMVPSPVRQGLSVESGLNDGIAVPFLAIAIAGASGEMTSGTGFLQLFLEEIGIAIVVGLTVGYVGGKLIALCSERGWMSREWRQTSVPIVALLCYLVATPLNGSGFIAAFVAGLAFGRLVRDPYPDICTLSESTSYLMTMLSFFLFGALILGPRITNITWEVMLYAIASLTIVRMIPVGIAMIGSRFTFRTVLFLGWFGPRGIASLVFAGTVVAEYDPVSTEITLTIVSATVALSVLLHGLSAWPLSNMYGSWAAAMDAESDRGEMREVEEIRVRNRVTSVPAGMRRTQRD